MVAPGALQPMCFARAVKSLDAPPMRRDLPDAQFYSGLARPREALHPRLTGRASCVSQNFPDPQLPEMW